MKKFMSTFLAGAVFVTSCTQHSSGKQRPVQSEEAKEEQVKTTTTQIEQESNSNAATTGNTSANSVMLNSAVAAMMKAGDMYIKDFEGKDISLDQYKLNPGQYFLVFKKSVEATSFAALNTTVSPIADMKADKRFTLTYKIYDVSGAGKDFKGSNLADPKITKSLTLDGNPAELLSNKAAISAFIDAIKETKLADSKTFSNKVSNFLFPTAYASWSYSDFNDSLWITALVFTSVSAVAYLFSFYTVGTISAAGAITFWLLYFYVTAWLGK